MAQPEVWFVQNDMICSLSGVRSSTMASTAYLNSSTGVTVSVWDGLSTASTTNRVINARNLGYVAASNGNYRGVMQSTESTKLGIGENGLAIFTLVHSGLNGHWRLPFRVDYRVST